MEEIRRADIFVEQRVLDELYSAVEEVAYGGREILEKAEHLQELDELILNIADELSGFPEDYNYNKMGYLGYDGDPLETAVHIYRNVLDDCPPDRVTYCALTDDYYGSDEGFLEEPGLPDLDNYFKV